MSSSTFSSVRERSFARELARIQKSADKAVLRGSDAPAARIAIEAIDLCGLMLHDLAHQHGESELLRGDLRIEREAFQRLFGVLPTPCVASDRTGIIALANTAAGKLFSLAPSHLVGRALVLFFQNRSSFDAALQDANARPDAVSFRGRIRPRDRPVVQTEVLAVQADEASLFWFLSAAVTFEPGVARSQPPLVQPELAHPLHVGPDLLVGDQQ